MLSFNLILIFSPLPCHWETKRPNTQETNSPVPQSAQMQFLLYCPCARQSQHESLWSLQDSTQYLTPLPELGSHRDLGPGPTNDGTHSTTSGSYSYFPPDGCLCTNHNVLSGFTFSRIRPWEFPGSPMVRTACFHSSQNIAKKIYRQDRRHTDMTFERSHQK